MKCPNRDDAPPKRTRSPSLEKLSAGSPKPKIHRRAADVFVEMIIVIIFENSKRHNCRYIVMLLIRCYICTT